MGAIPGTIPLTGVVAPKNAEDTYPVIDPVYGTDGLRNVADNTARNAIPELRRRAGMIVGTQSDSKYWKLLPAPWNYDDTDWEEFRLGGAGSGFSRIIFVDAINGDDELIEGRGQAGLPFKTLYAARNYINDTERNQFVQFGDTNTDGTISNLDDTSIMFPGMKVVGNASGKLDKATVVKRIIDSTTIEVSPVPLVNENTVMLVFNIPWVIMVMPGFYEVGNNQNLGIDGVDWYFHKDAIINKMGTEHLFKYTGVSRQLFGSSIYGHAQFFMNDSLYASGFTSGNYCYYKSVYEFESLEYSMLGSYIFTCMFYDNIKIKARSIKSSTCPIFNCVGSLSLFSDSADFTLDCDIIEYTGVDSIGYIGVYKNNTIIGKTYSSTNIGIYFIPPTAAGAHIIQLNEFISGGISIAPVAHATDTDTAVWDIKCQKISEISISSGCGQWIFDGRCRILNINNSVLWNGGYVNQLIVDTESRICTINTSMYVDVTDRYYSIDISGPASADISLCENINTDSGYGSSIILKNPDGYDQNQYIKLRGNGKVRLIQPISIDNVNVHLLSDFEFYNDYTDKDYSIDLLDNAYLYVFDKLVSTYNGTHPSIIYTGNSVSNPKIILNGARLYVSDSSAYPIKTPYAMDIAVLGSGCVTNKNFMVESLPDQALITNVTGGAILLLDPVSYPGETY